MKKDLPSTGNDFPELDVKTIHGELNWSNDYGLAGLSYLAVPASFGEEVIFEPASTEEQARENLENTSAAAGSSATKSCRNSLKYRLAQLSLTEDS